MLDNINKLYYNISKYKDNLYFGRYIMHDTLSIFAERLNKLILERFGSVNKFSKQIGIPSPTIFRWLNKERCPNIKFLLQIAIFLHVSTDYLIGLK